MLGIIGAGISALSSIGGGIAAARRARKIKQRVNNQLKENENWYDRKSKEDYTQTVDSLNLIDRANKYANDSIRRAKATSAITGGGRASEAAAREASGNMMTNTYRSLASAGQQYKANVENTYRGNKQALQNQLSGLDSQAAAGIQNAVGGLTGIANAMILADDAFSWGKKKTDTTNSKGLYPGKPSDDANIVNLDGWGDLDTSDLNQYRKH